MRTPGSKIHHLNARDFQNNTVRYKTPEPHRDTSILRSETPGSRRDLQYSIFGESSHLAHLFLKYIVIINCCVLHSFLLETYNYQVTNNYLLHR
jgi:hypothetical protein